MEAGAEELYQEIELLKAEISRLRKSLHQLTPPLSVVLKRRGFIIYKKEPREDLMVPDGKFLDGYYEMLKKYSFRLFLRDIIKHQPSFTAAQVVRYATREVTQEYITYLSGIGLIASVDNAYILANGPIKSFGTTLEWFVAECLMRELSTEAVWGVKMKRPAIGGDYDLLAKIDGSILYMEIKSSPPKQIYQSEVKAFLDRVYYLAPEMSVFFMDTELRMKDKMVPMFEDEFRRRFTAPPEVRRMEKELFEIVGISGDTPKIFIINAKDSIVHNVEKVLAAYFRRYKIK